MRECSFRALVLGALWARAVVRRQPFEHALLFAVVVWGGLFFVRSLGRSDWAHLESALPPMCLLLAHAAWTGLNALPVRAAAWREGRWPRRSAEVALAAALLLSWGYAGGADLVLRSTPIGMPQRAVRSMQPHTWVHSARIAQRMDAAPGDLLLFVADQWEVTCKVLHALRTKLGADMKLYDPEGYELVRSTFSPTLQRSLKWPPAG